MVEERDEECAPREAGHPAEGVHRPKVESNVWDVLLLEVPVPAILGRVKEEWGCTASGSAGTCHIRKSGGVLLLEVPVPIGVPGKFPPPNVNLARANYANQSTELLMPAHIGCFSMSTTLRRLSHRCSYTFESSIQPRCDPAGGTRVHHRWRVVV